MVAPAKRQKTEGLQHVRDVLAGRASDVDLVDRIFALVLEMFPDIPRTKLDEAKEAAREEFAGEELYIPKQSPTERQKKVAECLALFNGRNATEVARKLNMSRAWVYRVLKQAGRGAL